jgi:hypothetical protein
LLRRASRLCRVAADRLWTYYKSVRALNLMWAGQAPAHPHLAPEHIFSCCRAKPRFTHIRLWSKYPVVACEHVCAIVCVCARVCACVCDFICVHVCTQACMHVLAGVCMCEYMRACVDVCTPIRTDDTGAKLSLRKLRCLTLFFRHTQGGWVLQMLLDKLCSIV